jgi:hypothetical protein
MNQRTHVPGSAVGYGPNGKKRFRRGEKVGGCGWHAGVFVKRKGDFLEIFSRNSDGRATAKREPDGISSVVFRRLKGGQLAHPLAWRCRLSSLSPAVNGSHFLDKMSRNAASRRGADRPRTGDSTAPFDPKRTVPGFKRPVLGEPQPDYSGNNANVHSESPVCTLLLTARRPRMPHHIKALRPGVQDVARRGADCENRRPSGTAELGSRLTDATHEGRSRRAVRTLSRYAGTRTPATAIVAAL